jgi:tRNA modification GTPase
LLQRHGAELVPSEELLRRIAESHSDLSTIEIEAKVAQFKARTVAGTKLILNQIDFGLCKKARDWLGNFNEISLDEIKDDVLTVVRQSERARLIIEGCMVILAGPPNSGKSTLLNTLAGREKAIVSHIEGTTRDWVEAQCHIAPLEVTLIDTAGLDEALASESASEVDGDSQKRSSKMLERADLVLLVLDNSRGVEQVSPRIISAIEGKNVLVVLNQCDLPTAFDASALPDMLGTPVQISAKDNKGIDELHRRILEATGTAEFDLHTPVAFTDRLRQIMSQLAAAESKADAKALISKLLNESLSV